ncbi:hypothetical protein K3495_g15313 [Podosphaera aphanis]|nr:hypothetical protein K3495_g15313 [Podosphaera aphanis]
MIESEVDARDNPHHITRTPILRGTKKSSDQIVKASESWERNEDDAVDSMQTARKYLELRFISTLRRPNQQKHALSGALYAVQPATNAHASDQAYAAPGSFMRSWISVAASVCQVPGTSEVASPSLCGYSTRASSRVSV